MKKLWWRRLKYSSMHVHFRPIQTHLPSRQVLYTYANRRSIPLHQARTDAHRQMGVLSSLVYPRSESVVSGFFEVPIVWLHDPISRCGIKPDKYSSLAFISRIDLSRHYLASCTRTPTHAERGHETNLRSLASWSSAVPSQSSHFTSYKM
jgi:hypothetical protein